MSAEYAPVRTYEPDSSTESELFLSEDAGFAIKERPQRSRLTVVIFLIVTILISIFILVDDDIPNKIQPDSDFESVTFDVNLHNSHQIKKVQYTTVK